jgi:hypothetical protein
MKSVIAVVAGLAVFGAALFAMEPVTGAVVDFDTRGRWLWLAWEAIAMIAAGYAAGRLAPRAPAAHAVAVAMLQAAMTAGAWYVMRHDGRSPVWFWAVGIALTIPAAWCGGVISTRLSGLRGVRRPERFRAGQ